MIFRDRTDSGERLAGALAKSDATRVIALPRGGVVVGFEIAKALGLSLDIVCPRKIGAPGNPEFAIGAIAESGRPMLHREVMRQLGISESELQPTIAAEQAEARRRLALYRKGLGPRDLKGQPIILVDDGIATGSTMRAAISSLRAEGVASITVAIPVGPIEEISALKSEVDRCVCLFTPSPFYAIGAFYRDFGQTTDEEVVALLAKSRTSF